jgi:hypothetical protein
MLKLLLKNRQKLMGGQGDKEVRWVVDWGRGLGGGGGGVGGGVCFLEDKKSLRVDELVSRQVCE